MQGNSESYDNTDTRYEVLAIQVREWQNEMEELHRDVNVLPHESQDMD